MKKQSRKTVALALVGTLMLLCMQSVHADAVAKSVKSAVLKVDSKIVTKKTVSLTKGTKKRLKVFIKPASAKKSVKYKSSNSKVVAITHNGNMTGKKAGTAKITVTVTGKDKKKKTSWVKIKVTEEPLETEEPVKTEEPWVEPTPAVVDDSFHAVKTELTLDIDSTDKGTNWDGVSNVAQFLDSDGRYCFAYDDGEYVRVVKSTNGDQGQEVVSLRKAYNLFGDVICDSDGNYYAVTGRENETDDTTVDTVFITKYDKYGNLIKTVGDNGSSSLATWYGSRFYTKIPFVGGNCDVKISNGNLVALYAREMYSGHQSCSAFAVDIRSMEKKDVGVIYQSHSFAQRVLPYDNGFVLAGEGDAFGRGFEIFVSDGSEAVANNIFHFWVEEGSDDMYVVNNTFSHMGGLARVDDTNVALVGTSVEAMNKNALNQTEQLFIQIFNPKSDLSQESAFVTKGIRSGVSGRYGDEPAVDYGVKWLTNYDSDAKIKEPQVASDGNGKILILFEKWNGSEYLGLYCIQLNEKGIVEKEETCLSTNAYLNPCEMPVYCDGRVYWSGNLVNTSGILFMYDDGSFCYEPDKRVKSKVYVFSVDLK